MTSFSISIEEEENQRILVKNENNVWITFCKELLRFRGFIGISGLPNINTDIKKMAKALTKSQVIGSIADAAQITKKQAAEIMEIIVDLAYKNAKNTFTLPGLGKLVLVNRKARIGRNPATGEQIQIKAKRVVKFRVAKAAKDAILGVK
jgi:DNA-binding protein HU-beta